MSSIDRNVTASAARDYDVIVIGGGIYGSMILLEATRRGQRALLLEQSDFGSGTSYKNLRILHGGLRYLQTLDLQRFRESVAERSWFMRTFPDLVRPLPCLMPLYGGLKRNRLLLRTALKINDLLSRNRNDGLSDENRLPDGEILAVSDVVKLFPGVRQHGLVGGALWYDAVMPNCHRLLIETLRWACAGGASALNHVAATGLTMNAGRIDGVRAVDRLSGGVHHFNAPTVINAAGPAVDRVLTQLDVRAPRLFQPSLAWNLVIDRPPVAGNTAVAVQGTGSDDQVLFAHALGTRLFVGTGHAPLAAGDDTVSIPDREVGRILTSLNSAIPSLDVSQRDVLAVFAGQLPVNRPGSVSLQSSPTIVHHGDHGGPDKLITVSGVKFTTARSTASRVVDLLESIHEKHRPESPGDFPARPDPARFRVRLPETGHENAPVKTMRTLVHRESPQTLPDLLMRRIDIASCYGAVTELASKGCEAFDWSPQRCEKEHAKLAQEMSSVFIVK